jgi:hypothetical protein
MDSTGPEPTASGERGEDVFWPGQGPGTATRLWISVSMGVLSLALSVAAFLDKRAGGPHTIAGVVCLLVALTLGVVAAALVLHGRRARICIGREGLVCRDWRAREVRIPWSSLRALIITKTEGPERYLAVRYEDAEGRPRRRGLMVEAGRGLFRVRVGLTIDPVVDSILRHRPFATRREATTWWLARQEIYDDGPPAD